MKDFRIGYFLSEEYRGRGIITTSIKIATSCAFKEFDIVRVHAEPLSDNSGSKKALERAGYICEAIKNGSHLIMYPLYYCLFEN